MTKSEAQLKQFEKTVLKLQEVLERIKNANQKDYEIFRDSAIQRFEISFDICWKTLKEKLREDYGLETASPKKVFKEAFKQGLLEDEPEWLLMTDLRNETSHVYNEVVAEKVLATLPDMYEKLKNLLWKLKK